ncbi:MAG: hypothetical protein ABII96_00515 [Candidatus Zixiibacteriota bacterium]
MNRFIIILIAAVILLISSCGPKVMLPPTIDLTKYQSVGVAGFSCNAEGNMDEYATHRFIDLIRWYQKKARIIELDLDQDTLDSLNQEGFDTEMIRRIGSKYKIDALFTGHLQVEEVKPLFKTYPGGPRPVSGTSNLVGRRIAATVKASLATRLWDIQSGGTIWMTSKTYEDMVDQATYQADGKIIFDARIPRYAFWDLVNPLVKFVAIDLKPREEKKKESNE